MNKLTYPPNKKQKKDLLNAWTIGRMTMIVLSYLKKKDPSVFVDFMKLKCTRPFTLKPS